MLAGLKPVTTICVANSGNTNPFTEKALEEAYAKGYLGKNIMGTGFNLDIHTHMGAGAYICGEESALLTSLEGYRGEPRLKPPSPNGQKHLNAMLSQISSNRSSCSGFPTLF